MSNPAGVRYTEVDASYFAKRGLRRYAGVWSLWALGVGAVISGHFSGWNLGLANGWGSMLLATVAIAVMYLGHVVELGPAEEIYQRPLHPYSKALLAAAPRPDPERRRKEIRMHDDVPSPQNKPSGCAFRTRCPIARPSCADEVPPLIERGGREVACPYAE